MRGIPWWGWLIGVLVLAAALRGGPTDQSAPPQQQQVAPPPQPVEQEPLEVTNDFAKAEALFELGSKPSAQQPTEQSIEGNRHYYTWDRPDLGEQVNTVWIAPDDWWVKVSGVAFDYLELGSINSGRFAEGPLKGVVMNSTIPDKVLHLESEKWAARNGHLP